VLLLAAPTLLFVGMNIVWPYLSSEAARVGVSFTSYSKALSGGAFVTLAGPIAADRLLRSRISWFFVITMGIATLLACAALITAIDSGSAYLVGVILLPVCLLVVVPFYLALLLRSDPSGKLVAVSSAFFMIGTAIGPGVGGLALSVQGLSGLAFASILTPVLAFLATWGGARELSLRKG
jgi:predicted MFS family arabinose efflux permease